MRDYILLYVSVYAGALFVLGALVLTVAPRERALARSWFGVAVAALAVLPVTFCATIDYPLLARLGVAGACGASIGVLLYGILHAMRRGAEHEHSSNE